VRWRALVALSGSVLAFALAGCQACVPDPSQPDPETRPMAVEGGLPVRRRLALPFGHLMLRIHDGGDDD
jgi:hypothetical protein